MKRRLIRKDPDAGRASRIAQLVKNPPAMHETPVWFLGREDPLEKRKAIHSSILACIQYTVHGVTKSWIQLSDFHFHIPHWCWERLKAVEGVKGQDVAWHHWLNGHESEQAPGDGEGQGSLACCSPCGCKELDMTEWLNNN